MLSAFIISLTTQISINTPYPEQWANNNTNSFHVITYMCAQVCVLCVVWSQQNGKCINVSTYNLSIGGHIAIWVEVIHVVQCPLFNILKTNENNGKKLTEELWEVKRKIRWFTFTSMCPFNWRLALFECIFTMRKEQIAFY